MTDDIEAATVLNDETMLMSWGESDTQGPWIKLRLPSSEALEPFRGMTKAKGDKAGQRLATCLVEIGDNEQPVPRVSRETQPKGGPLSQLAAQWCRDERFQAWIFATYGVFGIDTRYITDTHVLLLQDENGAATLLRVVCGITSRADLDNNGAAKRAFNERIRLPYQAHITTTPT